MPGQLQGKCGGAQGIGLECARAYVREGARVAIADVDQDQTEKVAKELGIAALEIFCDVSIFLLPPAARFITGCSLPVSGGAEHGYHL